MYVSANTRYPHYQKHIVYDSFSFFYSSIQCQLLFIFIVYIISYISLGFSIIVRANFPNPVVIPYTTKIGQNKTDKIYQNVNLYMIIVLTIISGY